MSADLENGNKTNISDKCEYVSIISVYNNFDIMEELMSFLQSKGYKDIEIDSTDSTGENSARMVMLVRKKI